MSATGIQSNDPLFFNVMMDRLYQSVSGYLPAAVTPRVFNWILVALVFLAIAGTSAGLWWRHCQRTRFVHRFGILWDKKRRPFCPACRTLLGNWGIHSGWKFERQQGRTVRLPTTYHAFDCSVCSKPVRLVDHDGYEVSLDHALAHFEDPVEED